MRAGRTLGGDSSGNSESSVSNNIANCPRPVCGCLQPAAAIATVTAAATAAPVSSAVTVSAAANDVPVSATPAAFIFTAVKANLSAAAAAAAAVATVACLWRRR